MPGVPEDDCLEVHVTPADLAAVVADWCEAHGVGRVDLAIALLGADAIVGDLQHTEDGSTYASDRWPHGDVWAFVDIGSTKTDVITRHDKARAAALAVAAMRCDLEGR